jgi:hypothetical protein
VDVIGRCRDRVGYRLANAALWIATPRYRVTLKTLIVRGMDSVDAPQPQGAVSLLAMIGQCANTHDALDENRMVRVPLRLVRAARAAGGYAT